MNNMQDIVPAEECTTMVEVRAAIDAIDRQIVPLIAARCRYIEAAGRIKGDRNVVHDDARINDVVTKVLATARQCHGVPSIVEAAYRAMITASIAYEFTVFDRRHEQVSQNCDQG